MTKEEKQAKKIEKKEQKKADRNNEAKINFKCIIWRCVSMIVCCIMICATVIKCTDKYIDHLKSVAEQTSSQGEYQPADNGGESNDPVNTDVPEDETQPGEETSSNEDTSTQNNNSAKPESKTNNTSPSNDKKPSAMSKAEIIALFNKAANNAKSNSKSITQNYCENTLASSVEISNKTLASLADKLINANMGKDPTKNNVTYSTAKDKTANYPVEGQSWSSKLTQSDVKSATIKESNGKYTVTIELYDDNTPNINVGGGHAGKAFSIITKQEILDNAGAAKALINSDSVKLTFRNCKINATIDKNTGKLLTSHYYKIWRLALTALGIDVAVSFGLEEDFKINW